MSVLMSFNSHPGTPLRADGSLSVEPGLWPIDCRDFADPALDAPEVVCPFLRRAS